MFYKLFNWQRCKVHAIFSAHFRRVLHYFEVKGVTTFRGEESRLNKKKKKRKKSLLCCDQMLQKVGFYGSMRGHLVVVVAIKILAAKEHARA